MDAFIVIGFFAIPFLLSSLIGISIARYSKKYSKPNNNNGELSKYLSQTDQVCTVFPTYNTPLNAANKEKYSKPESFQLSFFCFSLISWHYSFISVFPQPTRNFKISQRLFGWFDCCWHIYCAFGVSVCSYADFNLFCIVRQKHRSNLQAFQRFSREIKSPALDQFGHIDCSACFFGLALSTNQGKTRN